MKRLIFTFSTLLLMLPTMAIAQNNSEFNSEQLQLRTELFTFLKEEGFMPELDSDGDVKFKSEGQSYYIRVSKTDENPMYVVLFRSFNNPEDYSAETLVMATKELNLYKGIKVICFDTSFRIEAEMYVRNAEPVKASFYKLKNNIDSAKSDVLDECEKIGSVSSINSISEIPFVISKTEVANVDNDNNIIQDYTSTIYDFKTKYLKPRITIKPIKTSGSFNIYVRLYKDNVLQRNASSSPEDFTYSHSVTINGSSNQTIGLPGWGSNNAGQWPAGSYRYEIWYNDYCIGSKKFKII